MKEARDNGGERPAGRPSPLLALAHWSSAAAGAMIASRGLRRRDGVGAMAALGGAALAAWGTASALVGPDLIQRSRQGLLRALPQGTVEFKRAVTINRPRAELYAFWRDLANLARLMPGILEIRPEGERRWHWTVRGPGGMAAEGDAELVEERADELIAWRSLGDSGLAREGAVRFLPAPGGRGSEVHVAMSLRAPAGRAGRAVASLFGEEPGKELRDGLRRFQQQMETGEIPATAPPSADGRDRTETSL